MTAGQAVERHQAADGDLELAVDPAERRRLNALYRQAQTLTRSSLLPKALQGKPEDVFAVVLYGDMYGLPPVHAVSQLYVIEGRIQPSAQVYVGLMMRAGHEVRWPSSSSTSCTVEVKRRGTGYWQAVTWTIEDARRAGRLDRWVERWVSSGSGKNYPERYVLGSTLTPPEWAQQAIDRGQVKQNDNWQKYPDDMLAAAAIRRAAKRICPDVLLGLADEGEGMALEEVPAKLAGVPATASDPAPADTNDEEPVDAELIGPENEFEVGDSERAIDPPGPAAQDPAADFPAESPPASATFARSFAIACRGAGLDDDDRHALVAYVTGGRSRSAKDVRKDEVGPAFAALDGVVAGRLALAGSGDERAVRPGEA